MRIGIDNLTAGPGLGASAGGMIVYINDLLSGLLEVAPQHEYVMLGSARTNRLVKIEHPRLTRFDCPLVKEKTVLRILYEQSALPMILRHCRIDVLLATCNVLPLMSRTPAVVVVQDTQGFVHPDLSDWWRARYREFFVPASVKLAKGVIAVSEAEKRDIVQYIGTPADKIAVVHHGVSTAVSGNGKHPSETPDETRRRVSGGTPYIFSISTMYRFKNFPRLVEAFCRFKSRGSSPHKLVIAGRDDSVTQAELLAIADSHGLRDQVICLGGVNHDQVLPLYRAAEFSVYVSQYETFGHPVLESMTAGCPLITSNVSSMPEIAGGAALLVDPLDVDQIADAIRKMVDDPDLRAELSRNGKQRALQFTWNEAARKTLAVLEHAYSGR